MAPLDPTTRTAFLRDLGAAQYATQHGVVSSRASAAAGHWSIWTDFCTQLALDPFLEDVPDPVVFLQVFFHRYRTGQISDSQRPVRGRTAEDAVRSVAQTFTAVGAPDPRKTSQGSMDFRLQRQLAHYKKQDPPPNRVKPVPITVLQHIMFAALASTSVANLSVADMICIAFFFLLRPGEYTGTKSETTPFRLCDVSLSVGGQHIDLSTASDATIMSATFATLEFTSQKNGVRGEVIGLGRSGNPQFCPVLSIARRVLHLRSHHAPPTTPLAMYYDDHNVLRPVRPADITSALRAAVTALNPASLGFLPSDVSARCLRAAGAMALLCANVDTDHIRLIGRWRSDEMLRYLHVQAEPVMRDFSRLMLFGGAFRLHPNAAVPLY